MLKQQVLIINSWLPWWLSNKESAFSVGDAGDLGLISGLRRSPGKGNGNPLQYSCLGNPMDTEACWVQTMRLPRVRHNLTITQQSQLGSFISWRMPPRLEKELVCTPGKIHLRHSKHQMSSTVGIKHIPWGSPRNWSLIKRS